MSFTGETVIFFKQFALGLAVTFPLLLSLGAIVKLQLWIEWILAKRWCYVLF